MPFYMTQCLGFNLAPSSIFFCFRYLHICLLWVRLLCCGHTSFKSSQQFSFFVARFCSVSTYKFPYMLTKIFMQFILTSTGLTTKVASVLALFNKYFKASEWFKTSKNSLLDIVLEWCVILTFKSSIYSSVNCSNILIALNSFLFQDFKNFKNI